MDKVTLAKRLLWTKYNLKTMELNNILEIIKTGMFQLRDENVGDYSLKDITETIRGEEDENKQNQLKADYVPVVFFNGEWDGRRILKYSNVTALDFDYISSEEQYNRIQERLMNSDYVVAFFRTFKKYRLKAIILHDNIDPLKHKDMYEQLMTHYGIDDLDKSCKDISRKTYLAWDNEIWINTSPIPFHYQPTTQKTSSSRSVQLSCKKAKSPWSIINILNSTWRRNHPEFWQKGNRATSIFKCACQFCEYGVPQDMAESYFIKNWEDSDMPTAEISGHVKGAYHTAEYESKDFY